MWKGMDASGDGAVILSEFTAAQRSKDMKFDKTDGGEQEFLAISRGSASFDKRDFFNHFAMDEFVDADKAFARTLATTSIRVYLVDGSIRAWLAALLPYLVNLGFCRAHHGVLG